MVVVLAVAPDWLVVVVDSLMADLLVDNLVVAYLEGNFELDLECSLELEL